MRGQERCPGAADAATWRARAWAKGIWRVHARDCRRRKCLHGSQRIRVATLRSDRLADWADYGAKFLGLQLVERTPSALSFRMDERKQRIFVQSGDRHAFGFEVDSTAALDCPGRTARGGKDLPRAPALRHSRLAHRARWIGFEDPAGNALEAFRGAEVASVPYTHRRARPGPRRTRRRAQDLLWFYKDVLGFALSDYILKPFKAYFSTSMPAITAWR